MDTDVLFVAIVFSYFKVRALNRFSSERRQLQMQVMDKKLLGSFSVVCDIYFLQNNTKDN